MASRTISVWMYLNYHHRNHSNMGWLQKRLVGDLPGHPVFKNLPANVGDKGSIPGPGRSHMPWNNQVSAAQLLSKSSATRKDSLLTTLKKAWVQQRRPSEATNNKILNKIFMFSTTYKHLELLSVEIDSIEISQKKKKSNANYSFLLFFWYTNVSKTVLSLNEAISERAHCF